ncbi:expressed unknown protein [Seminavis robusta]|uniref:G-protein coupled receptors family 1 profile domain-containing protein n=1 Tax=Seminavis robusta TaxID=568900 RepID=A0A9N8EVZ9_9STRA|nr:expressed unknown protein [Seminavis robusta]|eukprot:Sro2422_g327190.1 n/a (1055) ;mRNA; f:8178-11587
MHFLLWAFEKTTEEDEEPRVSGRNLKQQEIYYSMGSLLRRRQSRRYPPSRGLPVLLVVWVALSLQLLHVVDGQRIKQGCYDASPEAFACSDWENTTSGDWAFEIDFRDAEEGCLNLALNVFQSKEVFNDPTKHQKYLNNVPSKDPQCGLIQRAYRHCNFCVGEIEEVLLLENICFAAAWSPQCNLPFQGSTREEVLVEWWQLFRTEADIDNTCEAMQTDLYNDEHASLEDVGMNVAPLSIAFCWRLYLAAHLCPGRCQGGCFTEELPPTCEAPYEEDEANLLLWHIQNQQNASMHDGNFSSLVLQDIIPEYNRTVDDVCDDIKISAFAGWNSGSILNTSTHLEILNAIEGESGFCDEARLAYPHCVWCKTDDLCFGDDYPITCELLPSSISSPFQEDALEIPSFVCRSIWLTTSLDVFDDDLQTAEIAIKNGTPACLDARRAMHSCVWCSPHELGDNLKALCTVEGSFCGKRDQFDIPDEFLSDLLENPSLSPVAYRLVTEPDTTEYCKRFNSPFTRLEDFSSADDHAYWGCFQKLLLAKYCPEQICPEPEADPYAIEYLGAETTAEKRALVWFARIGAFFSLCGAIFVLYDSLSDGQARKTVYHQLLAAMSCFDLMTAISWLFATAPIDKNYPIEGAIGNEATCTAQGFFIQLGLTSVFYAMALALYYYFVIARGWKEFQLRKILPFLHGIPLLVGFTLAFAAIPEYDSMVYVCHLEPPSSNGDGKLWPVLVYVVVPLSIAIVSITTCMILVYDSVRKRAGASRKWSFGVGNASKMQQAVFWQAFFYAAAFYITWPTMFGVYLASVDENGPLQGSLVIAFLAPLQGALNALVYARPKILSFFDERMKKRAQRQQQRTRRQTITSQFLSAIHFILPFHQYGEDTSEHSTTNQRARSAHTRSVDPSVAVASERDVESMVEEYLAHAEHKVPAPQMEAISESFIGDSEDQSGLQVVSLQGNTEQRDNADDAAPEAAMKEESSDFFRDEKSEQSTSRAPSDAGQSAGGEVTSTSVKTPDGAPGEAVLPLGQPRRNYRQYLLPGVDRSLSDARDTRDQ